MLQEKRKMPTAANVKARHRVGRMQRRLLARSLAAPGWVPVRIPEFDKAGQYEAARALEDLGFIVIEKRHQAGRMRQCFKLTDLGRAFSTRFIRQVFFGGQTRIGPFVRAYNEQQAARAA